MMPIRPAGRAETRRTQRTRPERREVALWARHTEASRGRGRALAWTGQRETGAVARGAAMRTVDKRFIVDPLH